MEVCKNFRPATRNRLAKIQKQNISKTPRRLSGEMRVMRRSQARLDKSLEKLAVSLSNGRLVGRSPSQFSCNKLHYLNGSRSEERRQRVERSFVRTSCHGDSGYVNPSIMPHSTDLKIILEREE